MISEFDEQRNFVQWLEVMKLKFSAIPHETYTTSWNQKRKNKESGVRKGVPDIMIITPKGLVFVEMKKPRGKRGGLNGSVISPEQQEWINELMKLEGVEAKICHGYDEAKNYIKRFL